ncbi:MAG: [Fe-Fe] hydrogenase large subunit C-terminal domain-containing protein [Bacteroidales bacterium]|jgi:iron only hydrogenase large subunit-like protein|nr:[Fe-Fe] hydrogenase large subunit C-terminal domain-containing protein [Bacteroidales bacterium]MEE1111613.1 [Fe-Fe] hydrogenase large subunit C-terminal domain-containing protein [Bacteroidales bacterium]MEE1142086.1 [Fe-Fe] hydrogenase large subunit C-terminal domain-containing protein [Bacteroidales bacterium]MEE1226360.1 [Fe-Fe] hydrogenase large subunit C-terminal domain-containing protein [Bacteroidales bacterium]
MQNTAPVYTEKSNCQDCYRCVKACPVKAIKLESGSASIVPDLCIYCGTCTLICPNGTKKVRNDLASVKQSLMRQEKIIVSLAPSYLSEYAKEDIHKVIAAFKEAGFWQVSETAIGAEKVAEATKAWIDSQPNGVYISSCCPSAVQLIKKYYPEYSSYIVPVFSPMITHSLFLKSIYPNAKVAFVGPCAAKKSELDQFQGKIDFVLTFQEIKELFDDMGIYFEFMKPTEEDVFFPFKASKGNLYPIDGGMLTNMIDSITTTEARINHNTGNVDARYMTFSGVQNIKEILSDFNQLDTSCKTFLELMTCEGGCIKGPCSNENCSSATKRVQVLKNVNINKEEHNYEETLKQLDISENYDYIKAVEQKEYTQKQIQEALKRVNKKSEADELNCGGCGYDTCRQFAKALIDGRAENDMCVSYMRKIAQDKTNILLKKIPQGIVIVNESLKIVDTNEKFASMLGEEVKALYDTNPGLHGADITKLVPFHKFFSSVLSTGVDVLEQDIRDGDNYYGLSIFSVQDFSLVCGILQNLHAPEVRKDIVLKRTQDVIMENMKVVQKIAFLLGENASYTEAMLNSIVESHQDKEKKDIPLTFDL